MLLQVFFMATTIYGWRNWAKNAQAKELSVGKLENKDWLIYLFYLATGAIIWGLLMSRIHILMPAFFPQPAALPFIDAFTAIASVLATILLAQKKWESWLLWVIIDAISVFVYFYKGLYVVGAEYIVFFCIAGYGLYNWRKGLSFEK
jgi:nicotinamide mononucleotide transporter